VLHRTTRGTAGVVLAGFLLAACYSNKYEPEPVPGFEACIHAVSVVHAALLGHHQLTDARWAEINLMYDACQSIPHSPAREYTGPTGAS
jgi:hypothetical protein